jgi:hypothetical protein
MKNLLATFVVASALATITPSVGAQVVFVRGVSRGYTPVQTLSPRAGFVLPSSGLTGTWAGPATFYPPYSYWAAAPHPARLYVGYGTNDFPFHGRPYGYPYDAWSWTYLGDAQRGLARYYYPPLR